MSLPRLTQESTAQLSSFELPVSKLKWVLGTNSLNFDLSENGVHHKKDHIKISQFTKFEVLLLDCNHVEGFQNMKNKRL